jgi:hypothetical protein
MNPTADAKNVRAQGINRVQSIVPRIAVRLPRHAYQWINRQELRRARIVVPGPQVLQPTLTIRVLPGIAEGRCCRASIYLVPPPAG